MSGRDNELGSSLRQWRDRMTPATVGLPASGHRRSPGLRREELALLAGLSVDYLTRLEQGRSSSPSAQVLTALTRALRLSAAEREYLFQLAGQPLPGQGTISGHLTPGVQRLLDRLADTPIAVYDAGWTLLAWNGTWGALLGDASADRGRDRNLPWRYFTAPRASPRSTAAGRGRVIRKPKESTQFEAEMVADLRGALARYPQDDDLRRLIDDLVDVSPRFAELWAARAVSSYTAARKVIDHPEVGLLTLDCDVLTVRGADLRIIAYTAEPGSEAAEKLALLRVIGLQTMSGG